ncbi:MAG: NAD(P)/FAD-dependent oxidoreductase, partial [Planctomycetes bacterium]|nr:NAD(P)/FAD-dependent oxidoreductase [Planctomycetota bacterium]
MIVGAGAAGLMTAIWTARRVPGARVVALDGAARLGAKILVSGGGRCNVTNGTVTPADFNATRSAIPKRTLAAYSVERTIDFFREIGVDLHEEAHGKLFPDSNRARTVLDALVGKGDAVEVAIVRNLRVPRALLAFLVGGSLAITGAALQALIRNPLAEPSLPGLSGGAGLGA